jgi:ribosomal protein L11 methyltransferase
MNYNELSIEKTGLTVEQTEILTALLSDAGFESFEEDENYFKAFTPESISESGISSVLEYFGQTGVKGLQYTVKNIPEQNWNEQWEKNFSPIVIEDKILIKAPFHNVPDLQYTVIIEPKMSFGTGHHETTRLMLREMLKLEISGKEVLDMGCGTGILGIVARLMDASYVLAVDIDEWAHFNTIENFQLNNIRQPYDVFPGDSGALEGHTFHIILANINRNILLNDMPVYYDHLKAHGTLVISGILASDKDIVQEKAEQCGFTFVSSSYENNWISLNLRK